MSDEEKVATFRVELIYQAESGRITGERWREESSDSFARLGDLPSWIDYCPDTGVALHQRWHTDGLWGREGGKPATVVTNPGTKSVTDHVFGLQGRIHRDEDLPAVIEWSDDGTLLTEEWWQENKRHREGGKPAIKRYSATTGEVIECEFWVDHERISPSAPDPEPS